MPMEAFLWMFLPVFVAGGTALLSYYVMQARMEVALAKERESLAEARAVINSHKVTLEERIRATEEACKRQALDDFMHDIRTEERSYVRETKALNGSKKTMVMQERIYFRNLPLSRWIEHEMVVEDGDTRQIAAESVFNSLPGGAAPSLPAAGNSSLPAVQLANAATAASAPPASRPKHGEDLHRSAPPAVLTIHAPAFGAQ